MKAGPSDKYHPAFQGIWRKSWRPAPYGVIRAKGFLRDCRRDQLGHSNRRAAVLRRSAAKSSELWLVWFASAAAATLDIAALAAQLGHCGFGAAPQPCPVEKHLMLNEIIFA